MFEEAVLCVSLLFSVCVCTVVHVVQCVEWGRVVERLRLVCLSAII